MQVLKDVNHTPSLLFVSVMPAVWYLIPSCKGCFFSFFLFFLKIKRIFENNHLLKEKKNTTGIKREEDEGD